MNVEEMEVEDDAVDDLRDEDSDDDIMPAPAEGVPAPAAPAAPLPPPRNAIAIRQEPLAAPPHFNVKSYAARYTGPTAVKRLMFIASRCPALAREAYSVALTAIKAGIDTKAYEELIRLAGPHIEPEGGIDSAWMESADRRTRQRLDQLDAELNAHKAALNKDGIRRAYAALGDAHAARGEPEAALAHYARMRDFCGGGEQTAAMCLAVARAALDMQNAMQASAYVMRAQQPEVAGTRAEAQLHATAGLIHLLQKDYAECARCMLRVRPDIIAAAPSALLAPEDVATYGVLCAVAALPRSDLRARVLENASFAPLLDLVPRARDAARDLLHGRYAACLSALEGMRGELLLDAHLAPHVAALVDGARDACLLQYLAPYRRARVADVARALGSAPAAVEASAVRLIAARRLTARIDAAAGAIVACGADRRRAALQSVAAAGEECRREMRAALLRMSCLEHNVVVRAARDSSGGRSGGGRGGGGGGSGGGSEMAGGGGPGGGFPGDGDGGGGAMGGGGGGNGLGSFADLLPRLGDNMAC
ncbi:26S proteasome subunit RPN7-domain-containing protein [Tribonema minus]|uniref:26S proteasome subunit RPN7-domain-containing protein n=1 Tax=Tribonema minus TaxID=303371 RepID=A0A835ZBP7_9STRA|nr:26S proteasome subunit RPN7-domain-containing protein [Tribonema minus]